VTQDRSAGDASALPSGWRHLAFSQIDSTNDALRRQIRAATEAAGAAVAEGLVVTAERQTAGRGRRGRSWESPSGNLYLSILLAGAAAPADSAQISFVAAVALAEALAEAAPRVAVGLKWPNDLLVGGGKVSGILLESEGPWVVLGVGVNLASAPPAAGALYPPTSLAAAGVTLTPDDLLAVFCRHLAALLGQWREDGFAPVRRLWLARACGLGQAMTARLHDGESVAGTFVDLDADGALVMDVPRQGRRRVLAGDVFPSAPAADPATGPAPNPPSGRQSDASGH
jgi:BirA family biotin operon repressor/biotin-[acetyl-CoA-carboxylase] ligase